MLRMILSILIGAVFLASTSLGCQLSNGKFWNLNSQTGSFQTNDIERAQKEIDFPLVLPGFLPNGIYTPPTVRGHIRGTLGNGEVVVAYNGQNMALLIHESTITRYVIGATGQIELLVFDETEVQRVTHVVNDRIIVIYSWEEGILSFKIETNGIDEKDSELIVASLIKYSK